MSVHSVLNETSVLLQHRFSIVASKSLKCVFPGSVCLDECYSENMLEDNILS